MKKLLLTILIISISAMCANSSCDDQSAGGYDRTYCQNQIYQEADRELNENYKKLRATLDGEGKARLKQSQKRWIEDRNYECSFRSTIELGCATQKTISRLNFLQDRLRECRASGCRNSMLY